MKIETVGLPGCFVLYPTVIKDPRGYFVERFNQRVFQELTGISTPFVQDNESHSRYGVIRGLHAQQGRNAQAKLIRVSQGKILDVIVDIRPDSATFKQILRIELSAENHRQLYIPKGFLHGFSTLSPSANVIYKCDSFYDPSSEIGVRFDDPTLQINWQIPEEKQIVSEKDLSLPWFKDLKI